MKSVLLKKMILPLFILAGMIAVGCSDDDSTENEGLANQIIDTAAQAVVEGILATEVGTEDYNSDDSKVDIATIETDQKLIDSKIEFDRSESVSEMLVVKSMLYAIKDGSLYIYNLKTNEYDIIDSGDDLISIGLFNDEIFVGGESLFKVEDNLLTPIELEIEGKINSLTEHGPSLMIGTSEGLFAKNMLGTISLMKEVEITILESTGDDLWVGTNGSGLFKWDGQDFKRRYLSRDESLFDNVTTIEYGHNHLYVGTNDALYLFDGGSWKTLTTDDGLPSNQISSVDPSGWTVYIGTNAGVVSYFENEISPVTGFSDRGVSRICKVRGKLVAATFNDGILMKSGPSIKSLFNPGFQKESELASVVH